MITIRTFVLHGRLQPDGRLTIRVKLPVGKHLQGCLIILFVISSVFVCAALVAERGLDDPIGLVIAYVLVAGFFEYRCGCLRDANLV